MTALAIARRLLEPRWTGGFANLADVWTTTIVEVDLAGMAPFADVPNLLNKVRGALGDALLAGASDAVRAGRPCTWSPPCAAEVFFGRKPSIRVGASDSQITKPFVLSANRHKQTLTLRLRIFGFADIWTQPVAHALTEALRGRVRWGLLARNDGLFVPKRIEIEDLRVVGDQRIKPSPVPDACRITFLTPVDAERGALDERPHLIFDRLARRMIMLARWYDVSIDASWPDLEETWLGYDYEMPADDESAGAPMLQKGGHRLRNTLSPHRTIDVSGDLGPLWPLLQLGEWTHLGRGANIGLGRFRIDAMSRSDDASESVHSA